MIEKVHEHMIQELQQNTRTDTIFIAISVFLNLITLAVNSGVASSDIKDVTQTLVMGILISLSVVINVSIIFGLLRGKQNRTMILNGLMEMYKDQGVDKYYNKGLFKNYSFRYNIFIIVVVFIGMVSIAIPLIVR